MQKSLRKLGYVIVNDNEEYLSSYRISPLKTYFVLSGTPDLVHIFSEYFEALKVSHDLPLFPVYVLPLFESNDCYFVSSGSLTGDFPPWLAKQENLVF